MGSSVTLSWPYMWAATPICFWYGYWQIGQREKSQYYTSSCSNFSSLPLKWCSRCCKLEAELVMNKVNRSLDPILQGITLKWLCSGIEVPCLKGNPTYLLLELGLSTPLLYENVFVTFQLRFELLMRACRAVSRTIKFMSDSKCHLCICPLFKAKPQNEEKKRLTL